MSDYYHHRAGRRGDDDRSRAEEHPPHSRLFVIGGRNLVEEDFRHSFEKFGEIEWLDLKKDKATGQAKGITYIKFKRTSEAAAAMEEMNGKCLGSSPRPLKVVIATSRSERDSGREESEETKATRLFIVVPREMEEDDIRGAFEVYGPVEHVSLVREKSTGAPRGLAYVRFYRFSHAAKAFENCDSSYRAKFAEPKPNAGNVKSMVGGGMTDYGGSGYGIPAGGNGGGHNGAMYGMMTDGVANPTNCRNLRVHFHTSVGKEMFWGLFNIVPGLEHCELLEMTHQGGFGRVVYNNPKSAAYAVERIHGLESPAGFKMSVMFEDGAASYPGAGTYAFSLANKPGDSPSPHVPREILNLVSTIQTATEALKSSGFGAAVSGFPSSMGGNMAASGGEVDAQSVCSATLPSKQPTVPTNTRCEERLFFVLKDARDTPAPQIITDLFSRFGQLIEAYCLRGKKCGYARYASKACAITAMQTLNNQDLLGSRLKVVEAEEDKGVKRPRTDHD